MLNLPYARLAWTAGVALAVCLTAAAAQTPAPATAQSGSAADDQLLGKARTMYYSTANAGLNGFDCSVHPDWHELYVRANPNQAIATDDKRVVLLNRVSIKLHAHPDGTSTLDWTPAPGSPTDADSTNLLNQMHAATEQTLQGFVEFWTPFVDGSVIPSNTNGMTVTHDTSAFTLHAEQGGTTVTEVFSNDLLLEEYDVIMGSSSIKFTPSFKATPQGLLVERFLAHIQQQIDPPGPVQEMHVAIEYQTIEGFPIPERLNMEVVGTGIFNTTLDGCSVQRKN